MNTFDEIKSNYTNTSDIPYFELIKTKEWFDRRESIITRDGYRCTKCGKYPTTQHYSNGKYLNLWFDFPDNAEVRKGTLIVNGIEKEFSTIDPTNVKIILADKSYSLHVHHKFYILDKLPWEYDDDNLIVLCNWCHWEFHENNIVPVFQTINDKLEQLDITPCSRCHGAGWFPEYTHVESGICFRCRGTRYEQLIRH